jgi:hypothetical protein
MYPSQKKVMHTQREERLPHENHDCCCHTTSRTMCTFKYVSSPNVELSLTLIDIMPASSVQYSGSNSRSEQEKPFATHLCMAAT